MIKKLFAILTVLCLFLGCSKTNVQIPSYIEIDNYFTKVTIDRGTNNQNFTDVLVYANGTSYGTYPLGSKIPVLTSGPTSFIIRGVIRVNGLDILRTDYEEMKGCDTVITVSPGKVTHVIPVFEYFPNAKFPWMATFDTAPDSGNYGPTLILSNSGHPETAITYTPGFSGKNTDRCLALRPNDTTSASVQTNTPIVLLAGGVGAYMELNYQSNVIIHIFISTSSSGANLTDCGGIYPSATWKKMYLNLTEEISSLQSTTGYYIYLAAGYDGNSNDQALIDNIKIVQVQ
jgi:hypothetical protein